MLVSYTWLQKEYFDGNLPPATEVADALMRHSFEIEGVEEKGEDTIIDIDVLPNRAHDCLSHRGIAREISVILRIPYSEKSIDANFSAIDPTLKAVVFEPQLCPRYMTRKISGLSVGESPAWLKERLESIGQRSINAVVDATNYVLHDMGQPTHAFDAEKLQGGISVRMATSEEAITTLDGKQIDLSEQTLVIADETAPLAIAGVKGGRSAEVTSETTSIVLEAAHFDPVTVRSASRTYGIFTDSAKRFENEQALSLVPEAMEYLTRLIVELCGTDQTQVEYAVDALPVSEEKPRTVDFSTIEINALLGTSLSEGDIAETIQRCGWDYQKTGDEFGITVPEERLDITEVADVAEEIGRVRGYDTIESQPLPAVAQPVINKEFYYVTKIKQACVDAGFSEVLTSSFVAEGALKVANPVAQDRPYMRETIDLSNVFDMNMRNKDILAVDEVALFEIGTVFDSDGSEHTEFSFCREGDTPVEALQAFGIDIAGKKDGHIDLTPLIDALPEVVSYDELGLEDSETPVAFRQFSVFPCVVRDIAVWIPEATPREDLVGLLADTAGDLLVSTPKLIDEYVKEGRVSFAHRLVFQADDRTLTDEEVGKQMTEIETSVQEKGWEVR